jgi:hypothetical protein
LCAGRPWCLVTTLQRAKEASGERNRAALAQINAEIRREKAKLKAQIPDLVKLSKKKARKLAPEKKQERVEKIEKIDVDIDAIPDGTAPDRVRRKDRLLAQAGPININVGAFPSFPHTRSSAVVSHPFPPLHRCGEHAAEPAEHGAQRGEQGLQQRVFGVKAQAG